MSRLILKRYDVLVNKMLQNMSVLFRSVTCSTTLKVPAILLYSSVIRRTRSIRVEQSLVNNLKSTLHVTGTDKYVNTIQKYRIKQFSTGQLLLKQLDDSDVKKAMNVLTDRCMEARELLSDARESEGTVYFTEDMEEAEEAVRETVEKYSELLSQLSEQQRQNVVRTMGLKMEELKAQLNAMIEELKEEH